MLPPLERARAHDVLLGDTRLSTLNYLVDLFMENFAVQDFASLGSHSMPVSAPSERIYQIARRRLLDLSQACNPRPDAYAHATPDYTIPLDDQSGRELWADTIRDSIRTITCLALGISPSGPDSTLPDNFASVRSNVVRQEFALLPEDVQEHWLVMAREANEEHAKEMASATAVQDSQEMVLEWLRRTLKRKGTSGAYGTTMAVQYTVLYVGEEDRRLHFFHDQTSSFDCEQWTLTGNYREKVLPLWVAFATQQTLGKTVLELWEIRAASDLQLFRRHLTKFFEELFLRQSGMKELDANTFWTEVSRQPEIFVDPLRLPRGITFGHPGLLSDKDFRNLYGYVRLCRRNRGLYRPNARFAFKGDVLKLSHQWEPNPAILATRRYDAEPQWPTKPAILAERRGGSEASGSVEVVVASVSRAVDPNERSDSQVAKHGTKRAFNPDSADADEPSTREEAQPRLRRAPIAEFAATDEYSRRRPAKQQLRLTK
ncbi:hypothetical protein AURDEDRAFT_143171 [Auricularia subglabra TFB-10046 SS5]|nr:hypothetical protein AURDEDRAFT_143171 [Auricularia subglabra TFB-10046 SS5]